MIDSNPISSLTCAKWLCVYSSSSYRVFFAAFRIQQKAKSGTYRNCFHILFLPVFSLSRNWNWMHHSVFFFARDYIDTIS